MKMMKLLYGIGIVVSIFLGFFFKHEHPVFPWHEVPSIDSVLGIVGAFGLLLAVKALEAVVRRRENFYD